MEPAFAGHNRRKIGMSPAMVLRRAGVLAAACFVVAIAAGSAAAASGDKHFVWTTKSKEAAAAATAAVRGIESNEAFPRLQSLAQMAVAADPDFAFGHYLMATFSQTPDQARPHAEKAVELAKSASAGERDYINAVLLVRQQKGAEALPILLEIEKQYPDERMVHMMLGQVLSNLGRFGEARAQFERAIKIDGTTPRAYAFIGNVYLLQDDFKRAREYYALSLARKQPKSAPFAPHAGLAFAYVYERKWDDAIKAMEAFRADFIESGNSAAFPEVFIWNAIGRMYLESGRPEQALEAYKKGFESVPGSNLDELQKTIWKGRLIHGTGRSLAKLGRHEEAWAQAETIKKMIESDEANGKQFWPAYHYIAGYLKYEAGDYAAAIEHMKQADMTDPFHMLILARSYEKSGNTAEAQKLYRQIVDTKVSNIERALAYPEAKSKLKG